MTEPGKPKVIATSQRYAHIAFPCVLRERGAESASFGRALAMLGGADSVRTALFDDPARFLELSFRPGEVYAHPAFAERKTSPLQLLCRVRVCGRRRRGRPPAAQTLTTATTSAAVLGVVDASYAFSGLFDFQVVPPAPPAAQRDAAAAPDEALFLPPVLFSRYDMPVEYNFQLSALGARRTAGTDDSNRNSSSTQPQQQQQQQRQAVIYVNFNDLEHGEVPRAVPAWAPAVGADDAEAGELLAAMRALFAARPVWSVSALTEAVVRRRGAEHAVLLRARAGWLRTARRVKLLSPHVAYYFVSGPWRTALVRLGFDPRADWHAAAYQFLDLRLFSSSSSSTSSGTGGTEDADTRRRTIVDHPRRKRNKTATLTEFSQQAKALVGDGDDNDDEGDGDDNDDDGDSDSDEEEDEDEDEEDMSAVHRLQCSPGTLQRLYCLYDVDNRYLHEICEHVLADDLETLSTGGVVLRALGSDSERVRVLGGRLTARSGWFNDALFRGIKATLKRMVLLLEMPARARPVLPADVVVPPQRQKDMHRNGHLIRRPAKKRAPSAAAPAGAPPKEAAAVNEEDAEEDDDDGGAEEDEEEEQDDDDVFGDDGLIQLLEYD